MPIAVYNPGKPKSLWVTVVIPPKKSKEPIKAFVKLDEALAYARKCPEGTRYASTQVEGDIVEALWPSHGWKEEKST